MDRFKADGSQRAALMAGADLHSVSFDTFDDDGSPSSTFIFNPGSGEDVVNLFRVDGTGHDNLSSKGRTSATRSQLC